MRSPPSLKRLELEGLPLYHTMDWFGVSSNLQELSFLNVPLSYRPPWIPENDSNIIPLEFLRTLRISRARGTTPIPEVVNSLGLAASILSYITSRALRVLDLYLDSFDCHQALVHFLRRSSPPLEFLSVQVHFIRHGDEEDRERLVVDAFSCVPSVRRLRYRGDPNVTVCPEIVVRMLSRNLDGDSSSGILPEIEHIELVDVVASIQTFVDIANVRCQPLADMRTLKSVSLFGCFAKAPGELISMLREELGNFEPGDDISQLPASLSALGKFITDGLQFRTKQSPSDDELIRSY
ncbi:hypothetical protein SCHPADRAFT_975766 [Schizopora paradoxa]|uniref:F-box domain-containing protein n=1 Tax=Schizopora paradoxa TaxID=27342 RepID=A0A0H2S2I8_9AGAM|nr:hypothetical protein SCHPADRAFT_975766 [Schizopora paradoxa]